LTLGLNTESHPRPQQGLQSGILEMDGKSALRGRKLLLMGSAFYREKALPPAVKSTIDEAIARKMKIIVGEAHGASRSFQDYLKSKGYRNVVVGHAMRIRYNAGDWKTKQYGQDLQERERRMIEDCDSAIVMWVDQSSVIAEDLERLKRLGKPTLLYEYSNKTKISKIGPLDPKRIYSLGYYIWHRK